MVHIVARNDQGPRANPEMPVGQRNAVDNLMFLCPSCHSKIDKNSGLGYPVEELLNVKERHESWTRMLRQAGSAWNIRYHHVDFVNLPRITMLPGGEELLRICKQIELDPERAFRSQGAKAGAFVNRARAVFENWGERALDLDPSTPAPVKPGMVVSFDSPMRARNIKRARHLTRISGSIKRDPHLRFAYGERTVTIRFDPVGLTTMTSLTTLGMAEKEEVIYAGLGTVVAVTEDQIQISAMVFGQPENGVNNLVYFMSELSSRSPRNLDLDLMVDARSGRGAQMRTKNMQRESVDAVLYFDELNEYVLGPESLQRATFSAVLKAIPEYRRELRIGLAAMTEGVLTGQGYTPADIAAHLLYAAKEYWTSISAPRLADLISRREVAYVILRGVEEQYLDDLDDILTEEFKPYSGGLQIIDGNPYHERLHDCIDGFRISGADLRVLYSARDVYGEGLDESTIEKWSDSGLFSSVTWEEDEARSRADEEQARKLLEGFF
ncbi:HNH endonuclease signature motif containing protein [Nocardiopsis alba]|uniref:HNH endonuclease signature motif containing protein n=1 Tax=Nocardiopsis alba TaxID=53437 RepID=UPI0033C2AC2C